MKEVTDGAAEYVVGDMRQVSGSNLCTAVSFFCKKSGECGENKCFTAKFNTKLTKIHRFHRIQR